MTKTLTCATVLCSVLAWPIQAEESKQSETAPPPRLSEIKKIYIEEMPHNLDKYIAAEMFKKFKGKLLPVPTVEAADAILTGTGEHQKGIGAAITGRGLGWHDTATAAVFLYDVARENILWVDESGDRSLFTFGLMRGGPRKVASRLMKHLDKARREERFDKAMQNARNARKARKDKK